MKFRYRQYHVEPSPTCPDGILYRPMVPIRVIGLTGDASFRALLDSGSDETLLPRSIGDAIGAEIDEQETSRIAGIAGQTVETVLGTVEIELSLGTMTHRWSEQVRFVAFEHPEDEIAILGHAGFLNYFTATLDGRKHEVTLKANRTLPKR